MIELGENIDDPAKIVQTALAQLAQQGAVPTEAVNARGEAPPPRTIHRESFAPCDLDGDGQEDLIINKFNLDRTPPSRDRGSTRVEAVSSADGSLLWSKSNHQYYKPIFPGGMRMDRPGDPVPRAPDNTVPSVDVDDDGVCDTLVYGLEVDSITTPVLGTPRYSNVTTHVALLSGADGSTIWEKTFLSEEASAQEPILGSAGTSVVQGLPTGFVHYMTPEGPQFALKTSDVRFFRATDPFGLSGVVLEEPFHLTEMRVSDRIRVQEVETGETLWQRTLPNTQGAHTTNLTWITGLADLTGDDHPELVLDQFLLTTPRGAESSDPLTGEPMFRFDRGMRVLALQGAGDGAGQTLWSRMVIEPGAPRTSTGVEENFEQPVWGHARIVDDLTDDGTPEVLASYLAQEESMSVTPVSALRTHFIPLEGESGAPLWDTKLGGWGFGTTIDAGNGTPNLVVGTVDVPVGADEGRFPPLSTRVTALTAEEGTPTWSHEWPYAEHSVTSFQVALRQYQDNLAPVDVDGDGSLDIVSTAQNVPPRGPNQQLLATQTHTYDIVSGTTGDGVAEAEIWGGQGLMLTCGGPGDEMTVLSGHPRRIDLTRVDLENGTILWEESVWNNPSPRTPSHGIAMMGLDGSCHALEDGSILYTVNMDAFSYQRRGEVVSIVGKITSEGERDWQQPKIPAEPAEESSLAAQAAVVHADDGLPSPAKLGVVAGIGILFGFGGILAWARWRDAPKDAWLAISLAVLMVTVTVPGAGLAGAAGTTTPTGMEPISDAVEEGPVVTDRPLAEQDPAEGPSEEEHPPVGPASRSDPKTRLVEGLARLGPNSTIEAQLDLYQRYFHDAGYPVAPPGASANEDPRAAFGDNTSVGYTHRIGDIDGDGVEDLLLDLYCTECLVPTISLDSPTSALTSVAEGTTCGSPHAAVATSGENGSLLWTKQLDEPVPPGYAGCAREFVMGTTTLPSEATGVLVYRLEIQRAPFLSVDSGPYAHKHTHTLSMLDAASGEEIWSYSVDGERVGTEAQGYAGDTFLLQPLLHTPRDEIRGEGTPGNASALFVQGVGAAQAVVEPWYVPTPGFTSLVLLDSYQPVEWAARIDLGTGEEEWRRDTYAPRSDRSVLPRTLQTDRSWGSGFEDVPSKRDTLYWNRPPCCGDLTGDGVPDLVYTTDEWPTTPMTNTDGPYRLASSLRVFDGASGERLYDTTVAEDVPAEGSPPRAVEGVSFFELSLKPLGDVTGNGGGEILLRKGDLAFRPNYTLTAIEGTSGEELWSQDSVERPHAFVIGDANGDGARDALVTKWFAWEHTSPLEADRTTLQEIPFRVVSGEDGSTIWRSSSITAPGDFAKQLGTFEAKGSLDVDQDNVADVVVDDPLQLDDQTIVHRLSILSGSDGTEVWSTEAAGTFAHMAKGPDVDGDGVHDVGLVSGDVNDLWLTMLSGDDGEPFWSRRLLNVPVSSYAEALPKLAIHPIVDEHGADNALVNLHLTLESRSTVFVIAIGGESGEQSWVTEQLSPQMALVDGATGELGWSLPSEDDPDASLVLGHTPATQTFHAFENDLEEDVMTHAAQTSRDAVPWALALLAGIAAGVLLAIAAVGLIHRRRELKEVPEL